MILILVHWRQEKIGEQDDTEIISKFRLILVHVLNCIVNEGQSWKVKNAGFYFIICKIIKIVPVGQYFTFSRKSLRFFYGRG